MGRELSIFIDESGDRAGKARYYLLVLVLHDQIDGISGIVQRYEQSLSTADLPNIPFHSEPLLNGHKEYGLLDIHQRKRMLIAFAGFVRHLPISYDVLAYQRKEAEDPRVLSKRMERDVRMLVKENLALFQSFDEVKVYYDNGQDIVHKAVDAAITEELAKNVVQMRKTSMTDYRLEQVADYLCTIELAALKYAAKEDGGTYNKFFGGAGAFKKNWLKQARRKRLR